MLATVGARIWARAVVQRNAGLDDWMMVAAMVRRYSSGKGTKTDVINTDPNNRPYNNGMLGYVRSRQPHLYMPCSNQHTATEHYHFNRHVWDVRPELYVPERKITFTLYLLYIISGGMIKISILLFYRRLDSRSITRSFRYATWINIVGIAIFVVAFTVVLFTACDPFAAFWYQFDITKQISGYAYRCWVNEGANLLSASIISAVQDAITAFLPTILYWNLHIPQRQKIALGAIFALGYMVCIVAGVRSYYVYRIFNDPLYDSTWESWPAWLLCMVEIQLGTICASAPALKVFLSHYFKVATSKYGSSRGTDSSLKKAYWWRSTGSKSTGTMPSRDGYLREQPGSQFDVDEDGGIVLQETKRAGGRTESIETFILN